MNPTTSPTTTPRTIPSNSAKTQNFAQRHATAIKAIVSGIFSGFAAYFAVKNQVVTPDTLLRLGSGALALSATAAVVTNRKEIADYIKAQKGDIAKYATGAGVAGVLTFGGACLAKQTLSPSLPLLFGIGTTSAAAVLLNVVNTSKANKVPNSR